MRRVFDATLAALLILAVVVTAFVVGRSDPERRATATTVDPPSPFYLVIGGSSSLGTQPTGIATDNGHRTLVGYANDVLMIERRRGVSMVLHQVGCPGETVATMLETAIGDHCYNPPATQLSVAVNFLRRHRDDPGLVSIDLGLNNIRPCISHTAVSLGCVDEQITITREDLPKIVRDLTSAAGPRVRFVGFEYEDPFLSRYLDGASGPSIANETLAGMNSYNAVLGQVYDAAGVRIANLPATFKNDDSALVTLDNVGAIPENVEEVCQLTWMCQPPPFGPDDHPNNEGYMAIAEAIADNLPRSSW